MSKTCKDDSSKTTSGSPTTMTKSKPLIYAELLSNIRQVSVIATLDLPADDGTKVELSQNGRQLMLHQHEDTSSLDLPDQVVTNSPLQKPAMGSKELSWRLQLAHPLGLGNANNVQSNDTPWSANSLKEDVEFFCRSCDAAILKRGSIKRWKDLPSENWAEMMDFWHCHKPSVPESNGHRAHSHAEESMASRGYGANTKFMAQPEVAFVGLTSFLLAESDCTGIEVRPRSAEASKYQRLTCEGCKNYLGQIDHHAAGYQLHKWRLKSWPTQTRPEAFYYQPSMESIISAQLQSIMLAQCCSRLVILPANWQPSLDLFKTSTAKGSASQSSSNSISVTSPSIPSTQSLTSSPQYCFLSMWVLSPTIRYSTTAQNTLQHMSSRSSGQSLGTLAMKVFWKTVSATEASKLMDSTGVEDVLLPEEAIIEMAASLRRSASYLPPGSRKFQDWDVGLLERFDEDGGFT